MPADYILLQIVKIVSVFVVCCITAASAAELEWPRLVGILQLTNKPQAVLVMPQSRAHPEFAHLRAGDSLSGFEVLSVHPASGTVRLARSNAAQTTDLKLARLEGTQNYAVHLEKAPMNSVVETYQHLSGRTVIYSPQLPHVEVDAHIPALPPADVLDALRKTLEPHDAWVIPYGDKYAFALREREKPLAESMPAPPQTMEAFIILPGLLRFTSADVLQVLEFYAHLSRRTVLRPGHLVGARITLRSQTPLSREEAMWVVEAALRLGALMTVRAGDKFVFVVPPTQVDGLPAFDPARELPGAAGLLKLQEVDPQGFLETYAALIGRNPLPVDPVVPHAKFNLRTPAALEPAEAMFAFEALAWLNNLAFQLVGDTDVKLIPRALSAPPL